MRQIVKTDELHKYIKWCQSHDKTVGFVPTMGALHAGHLSLVEEAALENNIVIVSVFVNPTQFNNPLDLEKYPRTIDADILLLEKTPCDVLFVPNVQDVYPDDYSPRPVNLGELDETLEGEFRPGHFEGVTNVVQRLFDLTQPTRAYFGRKDFQQVAVIKAMTKQLGYAVNIRVIDTVRDADGLALSSRNALLSESDKKEALNISRILRSMKAWSAQHSPAVCRNMGIEEMSQTTMELEYLEIVHPLTFEKLNSTWTPGATACLVAYCGAVRLIDNMELISSEEVLP